MNTKIITLIFFMFLALDNNAEIYNTGPSNILLEADRVEFNFDHFKLHLKLRKDNMKNVIDFFEINLNNKKVILKKKILKKIIAPILTEIEVSTPLDGENFRIKVPFSYFSKSGDYPNNGQYKLNDNLLMIDLTEDSCSVLVFLEEEGKTIKLK